MSAGIVGLGGSPSCGVATTLDLGAAVGPVVGCPLDRLDRQVVNHAVAAAMRPGPGVFVQELTRTLSRRRIDVPWLEHDLRSEWPSDDRPPGAVPVTPAETVERSVRSHQPGEAIENE